MMQVIITDKDKKKRLVDQENARVLYNSAGQWALHFSEVRMTVTTFLVGLSWAVVSVKWDEFSWPLLWAAIVVWLAAAGLFVFFTLATQERARRQKEFQNMLPESSPLPDAGNPAPPLDASTQELSARVRRRIWVPVWLFVVVTFFYAGLLSAWCNHIPATKVQIVTVVEPAKPPLQFKGEAATGDVEFKSVSLPGGAAYAKDISKVITSVQTAITTAGKSMNTLSTALGNGLPLDATFKSNAIVSQTRLDDLIHRRLVPPRRPEEPDNATQIKALADKLNELEKRLPPPAPPAPAPTYATAAELKTLMDQVNALEKRLPAAPAPAPQPPGQTK